MQEVEIFTLLEVDAGGGDVAVLVEECRQTFAVQAAERNREQRAHRIALFSKTVAGYEVDYASRSLEVGNLVLSVRVDEVGGPLEVLGDNVVGGQAHFHTVRAHRSNVTKFLNLTANTLCGGKTDKVVVVTLVPVNFQVDAVIEETGSQTEVELMLLFVGQIAVGEVNHLQTAFAHCGERTPRSVSRDNCIRVGDGRTVGGE